MTPIGLTGMKAGAHQSAIAMVTSGEIPHGTIAITGDSHYHYGSVEPSSQTMASNVYSQQSAMQVETEALLG